jgi:hypothetical protein
VGTGTKVMLVGRASFLTFCKHSRSTIVTLASVLESTRRKRQSHAQGQRASSATLGLSHRHHTVLLEVGRGAKQMCHLRISPRQIAVGFRVGLQIMNPVLFKRQQAVSFPRPRSCHCRGARVRSPLPATLLRLRACPLSRPCTSTTRALS